MMQIWGLATNDFKDTIITISGHKEKYASNEWKIRSLSRDFQKKTKVKMGKKLFEETMAQMSPNINLYM